MAGGTTGRFDAQLERLLLERVTATGVMDLADVGAMEARLRDLVLLSTIGATGSALKQLLGFQTIHHTDPSAGAMRCMGLLSTAVADPDGAAPGSLSRVSAATVSAGGTGYVLGDVLTTTDGTGQAAQFVVTGVAAGAVTLVEVVASGLFVASALPTGTAAHLSGGSGSGCALTISTVADGIWIGGGAGGGETMYRFKSMQGDYLVCRKWDGTTEGGVDVNIAKPYLMRWSLPSPRTIDGESVAYSGYNLANQLRVATVSAVAWNEVITPRYLVNDVIWAVSADYTGVSVSGTALTLMDANHDDRGWALKKGQ